MILRPVLDRFASGECAKEIQRALTGGPSCVEGVSSSSFALLIASIFIRTRRQVFVLTDSATKMNDLYLDISCFLDDADTVILPPWETLPYEYVSPPEKIERERISALYRILRADPCVIITTVESLMRLVPDRDFFLKRGIRLSCGDDYSFDDIIESLASYGYTREYRVETSGHFSVKGGIIDVFLPTLENPVRLDFFGDTLESIREFDILSQVSHTQHKEITIYPRMELVLFPREREELRGILFEASEKGFEFPDEIRTSIMEGEGLHGVEDVFPLVMKTSPLLSYISHDAACIMVDPVDCDNSARLLERTFSELYDGIHEKSL